MTTRYKILARDFDTLRNAGSLQGDRDALDARRLGVDFDSWPGNLDYQVETAAWRAGLNWGELSPDAKARLTTAYLDGYRPTYGETYFEG